MYNVPSEIFLYKISHLISFTVDVWDAVFSFFLQVRGFVIQQLCTFIFYQKLIQTWKAGPIDFTFAVCKLYKDLKRRKEVACYGSLHWKYPPPTWKLLSFASFVVLPIFSWKHSNKRKKMRQQYRGTSAFSCFVCLLILCVTKQSVKTQVAFDAVCPDVNVVQNFDAQKVFWFNAFQVLIEI